MKRLFVALLLTCLAVAAWGCATHVAETSREDGQAGAQPTPTAQTVAQSVEQQSSSSEDDDDDGEHSSSSEDDDDKDGKKHDNGDSGEHGSSSDGTVSYQNPGAEGTGLNTSRNDALAGAEPLDVVTWTTPPTISPGELEAAGELSGGAMLFNPMVDGEGAGFIVFYKGVEEPLVLLLPDLGPMHLWESDHTIADMEHEFEGSTFTIRAYSPLFMDVGPSDLEIRVYGFDGNGADALLAVSDVR